MLLPRLMLPVAAALAVAMALPGCAEDTTPATAATQASAAGETHAQMIVETIQLFEELNTVLEGVKDEASAGAAVPRVEALTQRKLALQRRMEVLGAPSDKVAKQIRAHHFPAMEAVRTKLKASITEVHKDAKVGAPLKEALATFRDVKLQ